MDQTLTVVCSPKRLEYRAPNSTAYAFHLSAAYVSKKKKKSKNLNAKLQTSQKTFLKS